LPAVTKTKLAEHDLDDIWFYIAVDNIAAADALLDTIDERCQLLAHHPMIGRARPELAISLRSFAVGRHVIFYLPQLDGIEIVRVLAGARDIDAVFGGP
jgi:toxin ParE1/3/4